MFEDKDGKWQEKKDKHCIVRLLIEPSQSFLDWQASNPVIEPEPVVDPIAKIAELEARIETLEKK